MHSEEFSEEIALQHATDMIETGSSSQEIGAYLQGKGLDGRVIDRILATASIGPLQRRRKQWIWVASIALIFGTAMCALAFHLQSEQQEQIKRLIESDKGVINMPNGDYVLMNDPDQHLLPGRIGGYSIILGLVCALSAFGISRTLKRTKQKAGLVS